MPVDRGPRRNEKIRISPIRLIGADGEQVGIIETHLALQMAREVGLDLVEVSPDSRPPVCKLLDYGRHKYEQSRMERQKRRNSSDSKPKEIRFRPNTGTGDLNVKIGRARKFLEGGHRVRMTVRFRGAEMRRQDIGRETLASATQMLEEVGKLESTIPEMQGRMLSVTIAPMAGGSKKSPAATESSKKSKTKAKSKKDDASAAPKAAPAAAAKAAPTGEPETAPAAATEAASTGEPEADAPKAAEEAATSASEEEAVEAAETPETAETAETAEAAETAEPEEVEEAKKATTTASKKKAAAGPKKKAAAGSKKKAAAVSKKKAAAGPKKKAAADSKKKAAADAKAEDDGAKEA